MRKRRFPEPSPHFPSSTRTNSLTGGFHGVWSSDAKLRRPTISPTENEASKTKLNNVTPPQTGHHHHPNRKDAAAPLIPSEGTEAPKAADGAKTSEYAFFKKLKRGQVTSLNASPLLQYNEAGHPNKKPQSSECSRDNRTYKFIKHKSLKSFSRLAEQVTPLSVVSCPSPFEAPATSLKYNLQSQKSLVPLKKVVVPVNFDFPSPFGAPVTSSGRQSLPEDVFCLRRNRLHRWVADTLCTSTDEVYSKGYDLVNVLVSRLFPDGNEISQRHSKCRIGETGSEYDHKILPWSEEPEDISYDYDGSLAWRSHDFKKVVSRNWDCVGYDYSASHYDNIHILDKKSDSDFDYRRTTSSYTESNTSFGYRVEYPLSYNEMELDEEWDVPNEPALKIQAHSNLLEWDVPKELDEEWDVPNEPALEIQSHSNLLEWDVPKELDEEWDVPNELDSYIASRDKSETSSCLLPTSPSNGLNRFHFSPFISNNAPNFASPLHLLPARYYSFQSERHLLDKEESYSDPQHNRFPLALTHTPNYYDLAEDFRSNTIFSSTGCLPAMSMDALFLSDGFDYGIEKKCLSITDSLSSELLYLSHNDDYEDLLDDSNELGMYDQSSNNFQISFEDEHRPLPLLLTNSSWDAFEGDRNCNDLIPSPFHLHGIVLDSEMV